MTTAFRLSRGLESGIFVPFSVYCDREWGGGGGGVANVLHTHVHLRFSKFHHETQSMVFRPEGEKDATEILKNII